MLEKIRELVRLETAMLLVVVVIAAGNAYLYRESARVNEEVSDLDGQYAFTVKDLAAMESETARLTEKLDKERLELARLQESLESQEMTAVEAPSLYTRQQAQDIGVNLIEFADERDLALPTLDTIKLNIEAGPLVLPAFNYSIVAAGASKSLLEMLGMVEKARTAKINTLNLQRDPDNATGWVMTLDVTVIFAEES